MATANPTGRIRVLAVIVAIAGVVLIAGGAVTWLLVRDQLQDENIVVSEDARWLAGDTVDGPLTAFSQADIINTHALEASGGLTYAELDREDPVRETMMNASFLRASLFTSVVAFGVAVLAAGLGVLFLLVAWALFGTARGLDSAHHGGGPEPITRRLGTR
jgi:hypothetical protein